MEIQEKLLQKTEKVFAFPQNHFSSQLRKPVSLVQYKNGFYGNNYNNVFFMINNVFLKKCLTFESSGRCHTSLLSYIDDFMGKNAVSIFKFKGITGLHLSNKWIIEKFNFQ